MPSIQVIIPAFNAARFISQTIDSVLQQAMPGVDVLVIDNASSDETATVVSKYSGQGVRQIRNAVNVGAINNHNLALDMATGDYIKLLSADDVLLPGLLHQQAEALRRHPRVGVVSCNCLVTDSELRPLREERYLAGARSGHAAINICARKVANLLGAPSNTLLRRSMVGQARFDPSLKWLGDLDFFCQVLRNCDYFNIDMPGFLYRRHEESDSQLTCSRPVRVHDQFVFAARHGGGRAAQARIMYRVAREQLFPKHLGWHLLHPR